MPKAEAIWRLDMLAEHLREKAKLLREYPRDDLDPFVIELDEKSAEAIITILALLENPKGVEL